MGDIKYPNGDKDLAQQYRLVSTLCFVVGILCLGSLLPTENIFNAFAGTVFFCLFGVVLRLLSYNLDNR